MRNAVKEHESRKQFIKDLSKNILNGYNPSKLPRFNALTLEESLNDDYFTQIVTKINLAASVSSEIKDILLKNTIETPYFVDSNGFLSEEKIAGFAAKILDEYKGVETPLNNSFPTVGKKNKSYTKPRVCSDCSTFNELIIPVIGDLIEDGKGFLHNNCVSCYDSQTKFYDLRTMLDKVDTSIHEFVKTKKKPVILFKPIKSVYLPQEPALEEVSEISLPKINENINLSENLPDPEMSEKYPYWTLPQGERANPKNLREAFAQGMKFFYEKDKAFEVEDIFTLKPGYLNPDTDLTSVNLEDLAQKLVYKQSETAKILKKGEEKALKSVPHSPVVTTLDVGGHNNMADITETLETLLKRNEYVPLAVARGILSEHPEAYFKSDPISKLAGLQAIFLTASSSAANEAKLKALPEYQEAKISLANALKEPSKDNVAIFQHYLLNAFEEAGIDIEDAGKKTITTLLDSTKPYIGKINSKLTTKMNNGKDIRTYLKPLTPAGAPPALFEPTASSKNLREYLNFEEFFRTMYTMSSNNEHVGKRWYKEISSPLTPMKLIGGKT